MTLTDNLADPMAIIFLLVIALQFATITMLVIALIRTRRRLQWYEHEYRIWASRAYITWGDNYALRGHPATDEELERLRKMTGIN